MASIIDNRNKTMLESLRNALRQAESVDILTAFFYFSGFNALAEELKDTHVSKYGVLRETTVLGGCMFTLSKYIRQEFFAYKCKDIDICKKSELRINNSCDYSEQEWLQVNKTIERLNLNENEIKTLECLISGKSLSETARTLSCGVTTVFDRRNKLQKKYLSLIHN